MFLKNMKIKEKPIDSGLSLIKKERKTKNNMNLQEIIKNLNLSESDPTNTQQNNESRRRRLPILSTLQERDVAYTKAIIDF